VFLVCAFAIMTVLAWATLRQALGGELDTTGTQEPRALQMPTQATKPAVRDWLTPIEEFRRAVHPAEMLPL
jgi:hypothetical protein